APGGAAAEPAVVDGDAVARVVSEWTGVPVARLTSPDKERLQNLEVHLRQRVVGQDDAINRLARAVRLGRLRLKAPERPMGVFLFVGPTGVGKTELALSLAG